jgi:hypothetical protein
MKDQGARQLEDTWTRFLAGESLAREERTALDLAVRSDDVLHRRLLHDLRLDGALRAAARGESEGEVFVSTMRALVARRGDAAIEAPEALPGQSRAPWRGRWANSVSLGVIALVGVAALVFILLRPAPTPVAPMTGKLAGAGRTPHSVPAEALSPTGFRIDAVEGQVQIHDGGGKVRPAVVDGSIAPGDWLATVGTGARVRASDEEGTEIELGGDAVATGLGTRPAAGRLFVARGRLRVSLPPTAPRPALEVASPHAIAIADGCFRLDVSALETRLEVQRLRVRLISIAGERSLEVRAGQSAIAGPRELLLGPPSPRALP